MQTDGSARPAPASRTVAAEAIPPLSADALRVALARMSPELRAIDRLTRLSGGANQETWSFDARRDDGVELGLILRKMPAGTGARGVLAIGADTEAALIRAAGAAGVAAPRVIGVLRPEDGLGPGFVMTRIEGETLARRILREPRYQHARTVLARQCGEALAHIHGLDPAHIWPEGAWGPGGLRRSPAQAEIRAYEDDYREQGHPRPVIELGLQWLRARIPAADEPLAVVHGDFRNGNLIVGEDGLRAVLDWELAHLGDPMTDLGWICVNSWRFGEIAHPVGGFGRREDLFAGYEAASGRRVDPARVHFWEVAGSLKWCVMCGRMLGAFRGGADRTVERAAIARRASEAELDLLRLLDPATSTSA